MTGHIELRFREAGESVRLREALSTTTSQKARPGEMAMRDVPGHPGQRDRGDVAAARGHGGLLQGMEMGTDRELTHGNLSVMQQHLRFSIALR